MSDAMCRSSANGAAPAPEEKAEKLDAALNARDVSLGYGERLVIRELSFAVTMGQITALVGPNGSGKSTLLKALARILAPSRGAVYLDGRAIQQLPAREVARRLAILPQAPVAPEELTVGELVEQGRYPYTGPLRPLGEHDYAAVTRALEQTGATAFRPRRLASLSGGERQRAWIALALAQETPILLLDEPTTFLDIGHQLDVLALVRELNRTHGKTIVLVLHDLNHAARYADRMVALRAGQIVADGPPQDVLTEALLAEVFGVRARILPHPVDGVPLCLPFAATAGTPREEPPDAETARTPATEAAEKTAGQRVEL